MLPNIEQVKSAIAVFLAAAVPIIAFLVTNGVPQNIAAIVTVVMVIAAIIAWAIYNNTHKSSIAKVDAMPDVTQITVKDTATDGVAQAAADPTLAKVMTVSDAAKP